MSGQYKKTVLLCIMKDHGRQLNCYTPPPTNPLFTIFLFSNKDTKNDKRRDAAVSNVGSMKIGFY